MDKLKLPTLLMVSENPSVHFWIKKQLNEQFFIIDASDLTKAVETSENSQLDFVIIDADVEYYDPLKLSLQIRKNLDTWTPILLITGKLKKQFLDEALESGVTDFLNNQLDPDELQLRIATGRKTQSLQEKTTDAFFSLYPTDALLSGNYLKSKFLLHDQALRVIANAKKNNIPLVALFVRIDYFETLQTQMGYLVASEILLPLSHLFSQILNEPDLFIPTGEGRFIILLQNTTLTQAKIIAETIRLKVKETAFETKKGPVHLTISMTLSSLEATEGDFNRMIQFSVQALKEADTAANLIIPIEPPPV